MGELNTTSNERRSTSRGSFSTRVAVSTASERPLPAATSIDLSSDGVLLAFPEPVGLEIGSRVVVSLALLEGRVHSLAKVERVDRGTDYRTYVAVTFEQLTDDDRSRLAAALARPDQGAGPSDQ